MDYTPSNYLIALRLTKQLRLSILALVGAQTHGLPHQSPALFRQLLFNDEFHESCTDWFPSDLPTFFWHKMK